MDSAHLAALPAAYLLGSIPFSFLVARRFGVSDVRKVGSGNVGATNVLRNAGVGAGLMAFGLDAAKGAVAAWLASRWTSSEWLPSLCAVAAVLGHLYPVWLGFEGGKGVATGAGAFLPLAPLATLGAFVTFVVVAGATRFVSLGSLAGAAILPVVAWFTRSGLPVTLSSATVGLLIAWKHRENVRRLLAGRESKLGARSS